MHNSPGRSKKPDHVLSRIYRFERFFFLRFKVVFYEPNSIAQSDFLLSHGFSTVSNEKRIQFTQRNADLPGELTSLPEPRGAKYTERSSSSRIPRFLRLRDWATNIQGLQPRKTPCRSSSLPSGYF